MKVKFKEKVDLGPLFTRLKQVVIAKSEGKVTYHVIEYDALEWVFLGLLSFGSKLPIEYKKKCISKSLTRIVLEDKYEEAFLLELLEKNVKTFTRKKIKTFYLVATISLKGLDLLELDFKDSKVNFYKQLPEFLRNARSKIVTKENEDFDKVVVEVKGFDFLFARNRALRALEVVRGMLNLVLNAGFRKTWGHKTSEPINRIRFSEFITIHPEEKEEDEKRLKWFILDYTEPKLVELSESQSNKIREFLVTKTGELQRCQPNHRETLYSALHYFSKAFDESKFTLAFLNAWNILELLTKTDSNLVLIKRVAAISSTDIKEIVLLELKALRHFRNESVHEGIQDLNAETACFIIQNYIFDLIFRFNLKNAGFFRNIDDSVMYLDKMAIAKCDIEKQIEILNEVKKHKENIS